MHELIEKKENLAFRRRCIAHLRSFFEEKGFNEVETPLLVRHPGMEPNLDPVSTQLFLNERHVDAYLITSPEYHMKRLLAAGYGDIWQLTSSFRDGEERSSLHSTEFKMLEWYMLDADYRAMANMTEELITSFVEVFHDGAFIYKECEISSAEFFERITCEHAFEKYANLSLRDLYGNKERFIEDAQAQGFDIDLEEATEDIFYKVFLQKIEPELGKFKPTFLLDYPSEMAALSKIKKEDPLFCERFELYISGIEIANAFTELTDPKEQLKRLKSEQIQRKELGKEVLEIDRGFIEALEYGMPESSGIALGFDRLVMILASEKSIDRVQYFSTNSLFKT